MEEVSLEVLNEFVQGEKKLSHLTMPHFQLPEKHDLISAITLAFEVTWKGAKKMLPLSWIA